MHVALRVKLRANLAPPGEIGNPASSGNQGRQEAARSGKTTAMDDVIYHRATSLAVKTLEQVGVGAGMATETDSKTGTRQGVKAHGLQLRFKPPEDQ